MSDVTPATVINNLDAIESLPFEALSGPEAGEQIRDSLIAEIRSLRAERDALLARLDVLTDALTGAVAELDKAGNVMIRMDREIGTRNRAGITPTRESVGSWGAVLWARGTDAKQAAHTALRAVNPVEAPDA